MINAIIIGDFGKDLDDEHTLILSSGLIKRGQMNLLGVIGNLSPAKERAALAKGTLNKLSLENIPVGIGTEVVELESDEYEFDIPYMDYDNLENGQELLKRLFEKNNNITLILQSAMTDAMLFIKNNERLFKEKIKEVVMMAGIQTNGNEVLMTGSYFQPDSSNNITFDWSSGVFLYAKLQELNIKKTILTRNTAYKAQIPFSIYDKMEETGNIIGRTLKERQIESLKKLFISSYAEVGSTIRGTLPPRCNKEWFINTFYNGEETDIFKIPNSVNYYDPINLLVAFPEIRDKYFELTTINVLKQEHSIIGLSMKNHGIKDISGLVEYIIELEIEGLLDK